MAAAKVNSKSREQAPHSQVRLRLYVAGAAPNSLVAHGNLKAIVAGREDLSIEVEVVDVLEHPELAVADHVLVTPMLVRVDPAPKLKIIGNLKDHALTMRMLGIARDTNGE